MVSYLLMAGVHALPFNPNGLPFTQLPLPSDQTNKATSLSNRSSSLTALHLLAASCLRAEVNNSSPFVATDTNWAWSMAYCTDTGSELLPPYCMSVGDHKQGGHAEE